MKIRRDRFRCPQCYQSDWELLNRSKYNIRYIENPTDAMKDKAYLGYNLRECISDAGIANEGSYNYHKKKWAQFRLTQLKGRE